MGAEDSCGERLKQEHHQPTLCLRVYYKRGPLPGERSAPGLGKQGANWTSASTFPLNSMTLYSEQLAQLDKVA